MAINADCSFRLSSCTSNSANLNGTALIFKNSYDIWSAQNILLKRYPLENIPYILPDSKLLLCCIIRVIPGFLCSSVQHSSVWTVSSLWEMLYFSKIGSFSGGKP